ncbi:MAG: Crp/Fnr family transcriptional regulator [Proteobacteria bacterium]|nr:Crp/Fnr family transcriptional regulator [Pseudomonadota bacterium]
MFIKQADIFWGIDHDLVKKIFEQSVKESHDKGDILFNEGDPAKAFYILTKGWVNITTGGNSQVVHVVSHPGEAFGWSSLVDRDYYSASAICLKPTLLIRIDKKHMADSIKNDPVNGLMLYKHLAHSIGNRLINSYQRTASETPGKFSESFGTGQIFLSTEEDM